MKIKKFVLLKALFLIVAAILLIICSGALDKAHAEQKDMCDPHQIEDRYINESSCSQNGTINKVCQRCGNIVSVIKLAKLPHNLGEYIVTTEAGPNMDGVQQAECSDCGYVDSIPYVCPHDELLERVAKEPACEEKGLIECVCIECTTIVQVRDIPALAHSYGDWSISRYATPESDGLKQRYCSTCTKTESQSYGFVIGENAIYAPGTSINASFVCCEMSQSNCDMYDLIYDSTYFGCAGPWIIGHKT